MDRSLLTGATTENRGEIRHEYLRASAVRGGSQSFQKLLWRKGTSEVETAAKANAN